jgi:DNA-binding NtrC family response regulator
MASPDILKGTRILAVDDEPDILAVIRDELEDCDVVTASKFEEAKALIEKDSFDLVILDIMGVNGFALLEACSEKRLPAAMLTAHAVNVESVNLAMKLGAVSFIPKEELGKLSELVAEILEGLKEGRTHWETLFKRLGPFFKDKLGVVWEDAEQPPYPTHFY